MDPVAGGHGVTVCMERAMFFSNFCPGLGLEERHFLLGNRSLDLEPRSPGTTNYPEPKPPSSFHRKWLFLGSVTFEAVLFVNTICLRGRCSWPALWILSDRGRTNRECL